MQNEGFELDVDIEELESKIAPDGGELFYRSSSHRQRAGQFGVNR